jgi:peptide/nickel transport system substrate-binding protein
MSERKFFEDLLSRGKITRREFITRLSAMGLVATVSPAFLASPAKAASPKKGGRFRMGLTPGHSNDCLDPATWAENQHYTIGWELRNNLVEVDYKGNAIPELAESWEPSADAKQWTFEIRKGIEFHNGKTLTSEDVIASINHHRGKDSKSAAKGMLVSVKDIKADGKNRVIFSLSEGNADFPYILSDYHYNIFPAGTKGGDFEKGIGTGGYILVSREPGVRVLTRRNPNYWKAGRAHFDEIETHFINDPNSRANALRTNEVDYMQRLDYKTVHLMKKMPGIQIIEATSGTHNTMPMLCDQPPFDNNHVRLAMKYAVDRKQMVKTLLRGHGMPANDHPIGPTYRFYDPDIPAHEYDPDKARFHLKKAGRLGEKFKLYVADLGMFADISMVFKEDAAKAGIDIELERVSADGYWSEIWRKKPFVNSYWNSRPTEDMMFTAAYSANSNWNESFWKNERFNKLLLEARSELDTAKRRGMYREMQQLCHDDCGSVVLYFRNIVEAAKDKVKYDHVSGLFEIDGCRAPERWWFA